MSTAVADEKRTKLSQLEQLKKFTKVVADTGDFESIKITCRRTHNQSESDLRATQKDKYVHLLDEVIADRKTSGLSGARRLKTSSNICW